MSIGVSASVEDDVVVGTIPFIREPDGADGGDEGISVVPLLFAESLIGEPIIGEVRPPSLLLPSSSSESMAKST